MYLLNRMNGGEQMRLFIAEKPTLGKAIAEGLGGGLKKDGYISINNGEDVVTWCFGHILEQFMPDDYDNKYKQWKMDDLPIVPTTWKLRVKKDASKQFAIIKDLIGKSDFIVNAGDPDREGQLLIDEVLEYVGNKKPVRRILLNALDSKSVKQALNDIQDNKKFTGLKDSALARSRADWLIGMNLSRAYSVKARQSGYDKINVGRVQTPTMALVVRREQDIKNFVPTTHYLLRVIWKHTNGLIPTTWKFAKDIDGLDNEGRLTSRDVADSMLQKIQAINVGVISDVEQERKQEGQPLPYSLSALQIKAGQKFGYSPQEVLDTMQSLYEKKLTTYPRSDCDYLPENQYSDAEAIISNIKSLVDDDIRKAASKADPTIHSRAWNDSKISAHHAIIPTTEKADLESMTEIQRNLYLMVSRAYLAQFYPTHIYLATRITVSSSGETFVGTGKQVTQMGWRELFSLKDHESSEDINDEDAVLPEVSKRDEVTFSSGKNVEKVTTPPKRFNPSTLLKAMKEIYKYVKDKALQSELKECSGIGTEATRSSIIEGLQSSGLLKLEEKFLVPTEKAFAAVSVLPEDVTYPDSTAKWEKVLEDVSEGKTSMDAFIRNQITVLGELIEKAKGQEIERAKSAYTCPKCGKILRLKKGKNGAFWGCSGYPECNITYPDKKGHPDFDAKKIGASGLSVPCPKCGKQLRQIQGKKGKFWACEDREGCNAMFDDRNDKPVIEKCPKCGKFLKRFPSKKDKKGFYWSCEDRNCKGFYLDKAGKPVFDEKK